MGDRSRVWRGQPDAEDRGDYSLAVGRASRLRGITAGSASRIANPRDTARDQFAAFEAYINEILTPDKRVEIGREFLDALAQTIREGKVASDPTTKAFKFVEREFPDSTIPERRLGLAYGPHNGQSVC
jgi:hypothetical protein